MALYKFGFNFFKLYKPHLKSQFSFVDADFVLWPHVISMGAGHSEMLLVFFVPRNKLQCKARSCDRMSSICMSVALVICDYIG